MQKEAEKYENKTEYHATKFPMFLREAVSVLPF